MHNRTAALLNQEILSKSMKSYKFASSGVRRSYKSCALRKEVSEYEKGLFRFGPVM